MSFEILMGQIVVGLINGSFYALLSLGFAVIFGLLGIINVAQGTFYMLGAFGSWMLLNYAGIGYWPALILSPLIAGVVGMVMEKTLIFLRLSTLGELLEVVHHEGERFYKLMVDGQFAALLVVVQVYARFRKIQPPTAIPSAAFD